MTTSAQNPPGIGDIVWLWMSDNHNAPMAGMLLESEKISKKGYSAKQVLVDGKIVSCLLVWPTREQAMRCKPMTFFSTPSISIRFPRMFEKDLFQIEPLPDPNGNLFYLDEAECKS